MGAAPDTLTEEQKNSLRGHGLLDDGVPYEPVVAAPDTAATHTPESAADLAGIVRIALRGYVARLLAAAGGGHDRQ